MPKTEWVAFACPELARVTLDTSSTSERKASYRISYTSRPTYGASDTCRQTSSINQRYTRRSPTIGAGSHSYRYTDNATTSQTIVKTVSDTENTNNPVSTFDYSTTRTGDSTVGGFETTSTGYSYTAGRTSYQQRTTVSHYWSWTVPNSTESSSSTRTSTQRGAATASYNSGPAVGQTYVLSTVPTTLTQTVTTTGTSGTLTQERTYTDRTSGYTTRSVASTTYQAAGYHVSIRPTVADTPKTNVERSTIADTEFVFTRVYTGNPGASWGRLAPGVYTPQSIAPPVSNYQDWFVVVPAIEMETQAYQTGSPEWGTATISHTCVVTYTESELVGTGRMPFTETREVTRTSTTATDHTVYGISPAWTSQWSYAFARYLLSQYPGYFEQENYPPNVTAFIGGGYGRTQSGGTSTWSPFGLLATGSSSRTDSYESLQEIYSTYTGITSSSHFSDTSGAIGTTAAGQFYAQQSRYTTVLSESWLAAWGSTQDSDTLLFRGLVYTVEATDGFAAFPAGSVGSNLDGGAFSPSVTEIGSTSPNGPAVPMFFGNKTVEDYSTTYLGGDLFAYSWSGGAGTSTISPVGGERFRTVGCPFISDADRPAKLTVGTFPQDITLTLVLPSYSWSWLAEVRYTYIDAEDPDLGRTRNTLYFMPWFPGYTASTIGLQAGRYLLAEMPSVSLVTNSHVSRTVGALFTSKPWNQTYSFDPWAGL